LRAHTINQRQTDLQFGLKRTFRRNVQRAMFGLVFFVEPNFRQK
jgi:hypothetical protein